MTEPANVPASAFWDILGGAVALATGTGLPAHLIVAALVRITGAVIAIEEHHDQASAEAHYRWLARRVADNQALLTELNVARDLAKRDLSSGATP